MTQTEANQLKADIGILIDSYVDGAPPPDPPQPTGDIVLRAGETWKLTADSDLRDVLVDGGRLELNGHTLRARTVSVVGGGRIDPSGGLLVWADVPLDLAYADATGNGLIVDGGTFRGTDWTARSENPSGTRGHIRCSHHSDVEIDRYTLLDLGRTTIDPIDPASNPIGVYPLHFHHCHVPNKTGYQFRATNGTIRNTVPTRCKWGIVIHASHYGLVSGNQLYGMAGAGIVTEDGSESFNVIEGNVVDGVTGSGLRSDDQNMEGHEGAAFWFRGPNNYVRGNVARNAPLGYVYQFSYAPWVKIPAAPGEHGTIDFNPMVATILEDRDNVAEDCGDGLQYWWFGGPGADYYDQAKYPQWSVPGRNAFVNFTARRCLRAGVYPYPGQRVTFLGGLFDGCPWGIKEVDYVQNDFLADGVTFRRCGVGLGISAGQTLAGRNNVFEDCAVDVSAGWQYTSGNPAEIGPRAILLQNNKHTPGGVWIKRAGSEGSPQNRDVSDTLRVDGMDGVAEVFFEEKAPAGAVKHLNIIGLVLP